MLKRWEEMPAFLRVPEVRPYYEILAKKRGALFIKRLLDIMLAALLLILFCIPMILIAIQIKSDSKGPVFFRQERVTKYGRRFRIHKFRTMAAEAKEKGSLVSVGADKRVTRVGQKLRRRRLDEIPQLFDVLAGNMSFVGTRPEAVPFVEQYKPEYNATLLMPAGITSQASILYKDEDKLLQEATDPEKEYVEKVLPDKMKWNLKALKEFSLETDFRTICQTVSVMIGGDGK